MKLTRWTVALYMALVFACGGVVGGFAHRLYTVSGVSANAFQRNPEEFRKRYMADMKARLQLTDDQAAKLGAVFLRAARGFLENHPGAGGAQRCNLRVKALAVS